MTGPRIAVAGAGAIGLYVGGRLAAAGREVVFLGRERLGAELARHGLTLTGVDLPDAHVPAPDFRTDPACLAGAGIVLVAVKSGATAGMAEQIAAHAPRATVISLQNGITNPDILRAALPDADVRAGMVPFNVVMPGPGQVHQATSGVIEIEDATGTLARSLAVPGLPVDHAADLAPVQWGKLLANLNNALNALSGLPLLEQLQDRTWRRLLAAQMSETLHVLKAAGIRPAAYTAAPPALVPHILRLPTPLFRRVASAMLTIDPTARTSMQEDLVRGRATEIDAVQGAVLELAKTNGIACPTIERVTAAIRKAEATGKGPPGLDPRTLLR